MSHWVDRLGSHVRRAACPIGSATVVLCCLAASARAAEPYQEFLDGLRRRGMFDVAGDYLDWAAKSSLVPAATKLTIPYEQALTLIEAARQDRDPQRRTSLLDQAGKHLDAFIKGQPEHPLVASAQTQFGNVLLERGRTQVDRARLPAQSAQKDKLLAEARKVFDEAQKVFAEAEKKLDARYAAFPRPLPDADKETARQVRLDLIQAKLFAAQILSEQAETHEKGSKPFQQSMQAAADKYGEIYNGYRQILAGLYARMWQGRCLQELGNTKQALAYFGEVLDQPDQPEYRSLKSKTLRLALQCWIDGDDPKLEEAVRRASQWLAEAGGDEDRTPEGLAIRWLMTSALFRQAGELKENDSKRPALLANVLKQALIVAKYQGDYQKPAKELVAQLRNQESSDEPTTFADARDKAKLELDAMEIALGKLGDTQEVLPIAEQQALRTEAAEARHQAIDDFRLALSLRDDKTPPEELNQARYFLSYLYYQAGMYYDAAVLGEFVARRYPDTPAARPCATLAIAALVQAYNASPPADRQTETQRVRGLAQYITEKWPSEADADKAWLILADMAIRANQPAQVVEYLAHIRDDSPRRTEADLKAGQALWNSYLVASRLPEDQRPAPEALAKQLADAQQLLERGTQRTRKSLGPSADAPPYPLLAAELSLAQLYISNSHFEQAVKVLEVAPGGILPLVATSAPPTNQGSFAIEALKVALQAYVGVQSLDKADATIAQLDAQAAKSSEGDAGLTRVYVSIGRELEQQVGRLRSEGKKAELARVLTSFEKFLDQIVARTEGNTFSSLNWVAETYVGLGSGLGQPGTPAPPQARSYFEKGANAYEKLLAAIERDPKFAPQGSDPKPSVALRLARCERLLGQYEPAINQLVELLKQKPNMLDAQIEAAYAFQAWGAKEPHYFTSALQGDRPAKRKDGGQANTVWGWRKLVSVLQSNPKFRETYYEAYYQLVLCAFQQANTAGPERARGLQTARSALEQLARTDPEMGGETWRGKFQQLLDQIKAAQDRVAAG